MSTIKVDAIQDTSGVEKYTAKCHCYAINSTFHTSGGFSSISDLGTGISSLSLSVTAPIAYYSMATTVEDSNGMGPTIQARTSSSFRVHTENGSTPYDRNFGVVIVE